MSSGHCIEAAVMYWCVLSRTGRTAMVYIYMVLSGVFSFRHSFDYDTKTQQFHTFLIQKEESRIYISCQCRLVKYKRDENMAKALPIACFLTLAQIHLVFYETNRIFDSSLLHNLELSVVRMQICYNNIVYMNILTRG